ncbi:MAG: hypothetical protein R3D69_08620 [Xanthobacteraceae bacterium]
MPPKRTERAGKPAAPRRPRAGEAITRINRSIEVELTRIDELLVGSKAGVRTHAEVDRRARTLASLARTLRELTSLRKEQEKPKQADDEGFPRDLGELRRALARRLEALVAEAKAAHPDKDEGSQS